MVDQKINLNIIAIVLSRAYYHATIFDDFWNIIGYTIGNKQLEDYS